MPVALMVKILKPLTSFITNNKESRSAQRKTNTFLLLFATETKFNVDATTRLFLRDQSRQRGEDINSPLFLEEAFAIVHEATWYVDSCLQKPSKACDDFGRGIYRPHLFLYNKSLRLGTRLGTPSITSGWY
jgi:hypothetical protein